jgi:outer membrane biosynthesis protein TonB
MFTFNNNAGGRGRVEISRIVEHSDTILRIGLVHGDRLISDRAFSGQSKVQIGRDKHCDIVLDIDYDGPPLRFTDLCPDSVTMHAPASNRIRVAHGNHAPTDVTTLVSRRMAAVDGDTVTVHMPLASRGRVALGPYTILFQIIRRRVRVPMLPGQSVIRRLTGAVMSDPAWVACLALSVCLVGAVATQAVAFQHQTGRYIQDTLPPEELAHDTVFVEIEALEAPKPEPIVPLKPVVAPINRDTDPKPAAKSATADTKIDKNAKNPRKIELSAKNAPTLDGPRNARPVKRTLHQRSIAGSFAKSKLWASVESGGDVVAETVFGASAENGESDGPKTHDRKAGVGGSVVKISTGRRGFGQRNRIAAVNLMKRERKAKPVKLEITNERWPEVAGKDKIKRIVRRKNNAVRRCFEAALRDNPGLSGKVKVFFTIGGAGTITSTRVVGASGDFRACIERRLRSIRGLPQLKVPASFTQSYVFTKQ